MTSRRKTSPVEVIDICDDDDDDNDDLTRAFTAGADAAGKAATATRATATSGNTNNDDTSYGDRKPAARASSRLGRRSGRFSSLSPVRKRVLSSSLHQAATSTKKKVKTEGCSINNNTSKRILKEKDDMEQEVEVVDVDAAPDVAAGHGDMEEDDVEVIVNAVSSIICPPAAASAATLNGNHNDDDDLQVVGTTGTMRLPHLREDCTEKTFQQASHAFSPTAAMISRSNAVINRQCCDMCYCYVCDLPASECQQWNTRALHCNAERSNPFWKNQRQLFKTKNNAAPPAAAPAAAAAAAVAPPLPRFGGGGGDGGVAPPERRRPVVAGTIAHPLPVGYHYYKKCNRGNGYGCPACFCFACNRPKDDCIRWSVHRAALPTGPDAEKWRRIRKHIERERRQVVHRVTGSGPFAPNDALAKQDSHLTECKHCGWYNRFAHKNFEFMRYKYPCKPSTTMTTDGCDIHPLGVLDWCQACGRVASENDYGKEQSEPYAPAATDVFLGTKTIAFGLVAHDPSQMSKYQARYESHEGEPEWEINQQQMEQELFHHRIGQHPTLDVLLASIPVVDEDTIPSDSDHNATGYTAQSRQPSLLETDALLVDTKDLLILDGIKAASPDFGRSSSSAAKAASHPFLAGDISATWDTENSVGALTVKVYIKELQPKERTPVNVAEFFGTWFGVFPLPLPKVCGMLHPKKQKAEVYNDKVNVSIPPFTVNEKQIKSSKMLKNFAKDQDSAYTAIRKERPTKSLEPGTGMSKSAGGLCTNETDFAGIMTSFVREMLPDIIDSHRSQRGGNEFRSWLEYRFFGRASSHREMRMASHTVSGALIPEFKMDERRNSMLSPKDLVLATTMLSNVTNHGGTIAHVMDHLVNLGHAAAPFVDGLTVELLPFQLQSLQWALERETTPGGLQSYWWAKLPSVEQQNKDLYYNPIVARLSEEKPSLVRGGFLSEQMGLGKTVICLSLILANPAPALPASGSPSSEITDKSAADASTASATTLTPFWDPALTTSSDPDKNEKHGSILCRGTLVVCNVSLVGQWIDEAKSKLKDPGLVYPYHGSGRKRDPSVLSSNAIVVTTYETLASDATYHAKKGGDDYVPPCEEIRWWRIICDEAHILRNGSAKTSAVMNITADHKWLVSGTPISTSINDLSNQLKFLGIQHSGAMMKEFNQNVCNSGSTRGRGRGRSRHSYFGSERPRMGSFAFLMRSIMMRHTQMMTYASSENTTLMSLPPMTQHVVTVPFSSEDQKEYDVLESAALSFYQSFKKNHAKNLGRHYLLLSQKLLPLRVACTGGHVPIEGESDEDQDEEKVGDDEEDEDADDENDADDEEENNDMDEGDDQEKSDSKKKKKKQKKTQAFSQYAFTSKLHQLIEALKNARDEDPTSKSLIFSQFNSTLKWLQQELPQHGFQFRTLSGDMSMSKRSAALRDFQHDPPTTVFILSMRAGAVGINLTQANRVFIMEPCLNPAIEAQAIGRVYRLGQQRPVKITRLIMEESVETRIREMLENKYGSSNNNTTTTSTSTSPSPVENDADDDGGSNSNSKKKAAPGTTTTTEAPPAASSAAIGSLRTEKTAVLTSEFDLLFGVDDELQEQDDDNDDEEEKEDNVGGHGAAGVVPDTVMSLMPSSAAAAGRAGAVGTMKPESI